MTPDMTFDVAAALSSDAQQARRHVARSAVHVWTPKSTADGTQRRTRQEYQGPVPGALLLVNARSA